MSSAIRDRGRARPGADRRREARRDPGRGGRGHHRGGPRASRRRDRVSGAGGDAFGRVNRQGAKLATAATASRSVRRTERAGHPMSAGPPVAATLSRLDLKTLRLFAAICAEGTLNGAARRAAIAPSAVSKRLAELEHALGCTLLVREPRGMRLTPRARRCCTTPAACWRVPSRSRSNSPSMRAGARLRAGARQPLGHRGIPARGSAGVPRRPGRDPVDLEERPSGGVVAASRRGSPISASARAAPTRARSPPTRTGPTGSSWSCPRDHPLSDRAAIALAETLDYDHVGLHVESSIYAALRDEARRLAGRCICACTCRASTRSAGWRRSGWGSGPCRSTSTPCSGRRCGSPRYRSPTPGAAHAEPRRPPRPPAAGRPTPARPSARRGGVAFFPRERTVMDGVWTPSLRSQ